MNTDMAFPRDKSHYLLAAAAAAPDGATIHKATQVDPLTKNEVVGVPGVGIKIIDIHNIPESIYHFTTQYKIALSLDHENIVKVHCSFVADNRIWVVMSSPGTPVRTIIRSSFPRGLPEEGVVFVLKETLKAIHYMHEIRNMQSHNIGAECVYLDDECRVKIGMNFITRSCHVMESGFITDLEEGKSNGDDIMMLGLLALELFYGEVLSSDEGRALVADVLGEKQRGWRMTFSCFRRQRRKRIRRALAEAAAACLREDQMARPTVSQLMEFEFFQRGLAENWSMKEVMKKRR